MENDKTYPDLKVVEFIRNRFQKNPDDTLIVGRKQYTYKQLFEEVVNETIPGKEYHKAYLQDLNIKKQQA
jgi:hypothetical protein